MNFISFSLNGGDNNMAYGILFRVPLLHSSRLLNTFTTAPESILQTASFLQFFIFTTPQQHLAAQAFRESLGINRF